MDEPRYCEDYQKLLPFAAQLMNMGSYSPVGASFGPGNQRSIEPVRCTNRSAGVVEPSTAPAGRWCGLGGTVKDILVHGGKPSQLSPGIWMDVCEPSGLKTLQGWTEATLKTFLEYAGNAGATTVTMWSGLTVSHKPLNQTIPAAMSTCPWFIPTLLDWVGAPTSRVRIKSDDLLPPHRCSLNGGWNGNQCYCDPGWTGSICSNLDLGLSTVVWPESGGGAADDPRFHTRLSAAWGGSILGPDSASQYHLYEDVICQSEGCMHTYHAQIVHAVSTSGVKGPYHYQSVVIPPTMENVQAIRAPSGEYLLYYLDHANQWTWPPYTPNNTCTGTLHPEAHTAKLPASWGKNSSNITKFCAALNWGDGRRLGIAVGASPSGPFELVYPRIFYGNATFQRAPFNDIECGINPSVYFHPNGTVLLVYRYDTGGSFGGETLVTAVADHWRGPYRVVATAEDFVGVVPGDSEECVRTAYPLLLLGLRMLVDIVAVVVCSPFVWMNARGYHVLYHNANHGCHAWSTDFMKWHGTDCGGADRSADHFDA